MLTKTSRSKYQRRNKVPKRQRRTFGLPKVVAPYKSGIPEQMSIRMKVVQYLNTATTTTTANVNVYPCSVNSLADPFGSGGSAQPKYYDQLTALYNNNTVLSSLVQFDVLVEDDAISKKNVVAGICLSDSDDFASIVNMVDVMSTPGCKHQLTNKTAGPIRLTMKWDASKSFGGNPLSNPDLQGLSAANPVRQQFINCWLVNATSTDTATNVNIIQTVWYDVIWNNPKNLTQS